MNLHASILGAVLRKEIFEAGRESRVRMMLVTGMLLPLFFSWTFLNGDRGRTHTPPPPQTEQLSQSAQTPPSLQMQPSPATTETPKADKQPAAAVAEPQVVNPLSLAMSIGYGMLLAAMAAMTIALESFVGEKERGTLEILLSTPATDRELFQAKLIACLLISIGLGLLFGVTGTVGVTLMARSYGLSVPLGLLAQTWGYSLALLIVVSLTFASLGVIISSRVSTVKAGAQLFTIVFMLLIVLSFVAASLVRAYGGARLKGVATALLHMPMWQIAALALLAVIALNWVLLSIAIRTFNRETMLTRQ
jgi:ABC-type Na+ efflux pump permease subunit